MVTVSGGSVALYRATILTNRSACTVAEALGGLSTVRAFNETERFRRENAEYIDFEDRVCYEAQQARSR